MNGVVKVGAAKKLAKEWFIGQVEHTPGLHSMFLGGSILSLDDDNLVPPTSDIDAVFVVDDAHWSPASQQRAVYKGLQLEVSYYPQSNFASPESVLSDFRYAFSLAQPDVIIHDPSGELAGIQRRVRAEYALPKWIRARCERIPQLAAERWLPLMAERDNGFARGWGFVFALNHVQQMPIIALLKPPTFRKAMVLFCDICLEKARPDLYEAYLNALGSASFSQARVTHLIEQCARAFDCAIAVRKTPFVGDWNIAETSRWYMVDTLRDFAQRGYYRETVMWLLMTWHTAAKAIENDALAQDKAEHLEAYRNFLDSIGFLTLEDCECKARRVDHLMAEVAAFALTLVDGG